MDNGDTDMELVAKKMPEVTYIECWSLQERHTGKRYGMLMRARNKKCIVEIHNPVHPELKPFATKGTDDLDSALVWAREQIESIPPLTVESCFEAFEQIERQRHQDEMSDDFAYSNGKIDRWKRIEREIRNLMEKL